MEAHEGHFNSNLFFKSKADSATSTFDGKQIPHDGLSFKPSNHKTTEAFVEHRRTPAQKIQENLMKKYLQSNATQKPTEFKMEQTPKKLESREINEKLDKILDYVQGLKNSMNSLKEFPHLLEPIADLIGRQEAQVNIIRQKLNKRKKNKATKESQLCSNLVEASPNNIKSSDFKAQLYKQVEAALLGKFGNILKKPKNKRKQGGTSKKCIKYEVCYEMQQFTTTSTCGGRQSFGMNAVICENPYYSSCAVKATVPLAVSFN